MRLATQNFIRCRSHYPMSLSILCLISLLVTGIKVAAPSDPQLVVNPPIRSQDQRILVSQPQSSKTNPKQQPSEVHSGGTKIRIRIRIKNNKKGSVDGKASDFIFKSHGNSNPNWYYNESQPQASNLIHCTLTHQK